MSSVMSLKMAQIVAPASFIFDFLCQQKGMLLDKPNMKVISDKYVSAFSPHPMSIAAFFSPQQLLQLYWLSKLFRKDQANKEQLRYVPYYALGNVCIGVWMFFWNAENLAGANVFVCINSAVQLWYCYTQLPPSSPENRTTRLVAQTFAGVGLLDFIHNTSIVVAREVAPGLLTKIATPVFFTLASFLSQPVLGACYAYDVLGIWLGQRNYMVGGQGWNNVLLGTFIASAGAVAARVFGN